MVRSWIAAASLSSVVILSILQLISTSTRNKTTTTAVQKNDAASLWLPMTTKSLTPEDIDSNVTLLSKGNKNQTDVVSFNEDGSVALPPLVLGQNRTILFVHVGKAGGETIKSVLDAGCQGMRNQKRRTACLNELPGSALSDQVRGYFHCFRVEPAHMRTSATSVLFNVRHPVDRVLSWYRYVNPNNCNRENYKISPNCVARVCVCKEREYVMTCARTLVLPISVLC
jgi:Sulfotransferase family